MWLIHLLQTHDLPELKANEVDFFKYNIQVFQLICHKPALISTNIRKLGIIAYYSALVASLLDMSYQLPI